ncbi:helix-turn-helix domain-containing protein [Salinarimonas ramus]|uniref:HigA2-like helix-turn-helix domain-containing protein n=1 Tax=Salinarimonas ramus TaxID=690164 RepID=A0A917Q6R9_9HYPH|nr:XRE family transcriptional regulator [Salinarimonas ramus]GGK30907.1 hypothetical protein GCM10011322_16850 [Salinarimonas ramus]
MIEASEDIRPSSGNVFADLGSADASAHALKARIVTELIRIVEQPGIGDAEAARALGVSRDELDRVFRGQFRQLPVERLLTWLTALGKDVDIVVRDHGVAGEVGRIVLAVSAPS